MEAAKNGMNECNYRAYSRNECDVPIKYALYDTERYYEANMCNKSDGGMYFETDHAPTQGNDIWIKLPECNTADCDPAACDGYRGEVMWCRKLRGGNGKSRYGIGVRFIVNTCDQCGGNFRYRDIHKADNFLMLCSDCSGHLSSISGKKLKGTMENYLMGNVI